MLAFIAGCTKNVIRQTLAPGGAGGADGGGGFAELEREAAATARTAVLHELRRGVRARAEAEASLALLEPMAAHDDDRARWAPDAVQIRGQARLLRGALLRAAQRGDDVRGAQKGIDAIVGGLMPHVREGCAAGDAGALRVLGCAMLSLDAGAFGDAAAATEPGMLVSSSIAAALVRERESRAAPAFRWAELPMWLLRDMCRWQPQVAASVLRELDADGDVGRREQLVEGSSSLRSLHDGTRGDPPRSVPR